MNLLHFGGYLQKGKVIPIARRFLIENCPEGKILDMTRRHSVQHSFATLAIYTFFPIGGKMREVRRKKKQKQTTKPNQNSTETTNKKNPPTQNILKIISVRAIETQTSEVPEGQE